MAALALLAPGTVFAQVANAVPTQPTELAAVAVDGTFDSLKVTWADAQADAMTPDPNAATSYTVYWKVQGTGEMAADDFDEADEVTSDDSDVSAMHVTGTTTKTATITGLTHSTTYMVNVRGRNTMGLSTPGDGEDSKTGVALPPSPPGNIKAEGSDETFTVTWSEPYTGGAGLTIDHYRVQKRQVSGGLFGDWIPNKDKGAAYAGGLKVDGDVTMAKFEDLENGITYQARVMATNSAEVAGDYSIRDGDTSTPGDEAAMVGDEDMDDEEEAPALPLVGLGFLGALLAGRGAWLRRRNA